jgi:hypothetical protein
MIILTIGMHIRLRIGPSRGGVRFVHGGRTILDFTPVARVCTPRAPYSATALSNQCMPQMLLACLVGLSIFQETVVSRPRRVKTCHKKEKHKQMYIWHSRRTAPSRFRWNCSQLRLMVKHFHFKCWWTRICSLKDQCISNFFLTLVNFHILVKRTWTILSCSNTWIHWSW